MDIEYEGEMDKKCFECHSSAIDVLNIAYNPTNSVLLLWNKYQIYIYEDLNFEAYTKVLIPEFQIHSLIVTNNYLLSLDKSDNLHVTSLKFKSSAQKQLKCAFQPREQKIKSFYLFTEDAVLILKFEFETYFLCLHKISSNFELLKKVILLSNCDSWMDKRIDENYTLFTVKCDKLQSNTLMKIFSTENVTSDSYLVFISDVNTLYGCLFHTKMDDETSLVKLYSNPSKIVNMKIIITGDQLNLVLAIDIGSLIVLNLNDTSKPPQIIHLNTAIHKIVLSNEFLIYTDGESMWRAGNIFRKEIDFQELSIQYVNDITVCNNKVICTTFSKLVYILSLTEDFYNPKEYCPAEKVIKNSDCLENIFEEIDKSVTLVKKVKEEENYIMAMSLSNRQDVMNRVIHCKAIVYENYEEVIKENGEIILTDKMSEYFISDNQIASVKITILNIQQKIYATISSLDLNVHITMSVKNKVIKTTCMKMKTPLREFNYMIPFNLENNSALTIDIKIISVIPGSLIERKKIWTILYKKSIILNSEHFIRTETNNSKVCLAQNRESLEVLILKLCQNKMRQYEYGDLLKMAESKDHLPSINMSMFVKLPPNYEEIFKINEFYFNIFNKTKTKFLMEQLNLEEFIKSKSPLTLAVCKEKVNIEIQNDGFSFPILKVASNNIVTTFHIRNFLANLLYQDYGSYEPGKEFISCSSYASTENAQKAIKDLIITSDYEEFVPITEHFEKNIIGMLPL